MSNLSAPSEASSEAPHEASLEARPSPLSVTSAFLLQLREVMIIVLSTVATFVAIDGAGVHPVVASACVGLFGSGLPALGAIDRTTLHANIYIGCFAGMCSGSMVTGLHDVVNIGLATGVMALIFRNVFTGFGGKMGSIAFAGNVLLFWREGIRIGDVIALENPVPAMAILACGALGTFELAQRVQMLKTRLVMASAVVTLSFCLLWFGLYSLWAGLAFIMSFEQAAALVFCGSFIGMSSHPSIDRNVIAIAVVLLGVAFPFGIYTLGLYGGTLGFLAFVSLLLALWLRKAGVGLRRLSS